MQNKRSQKHRRQLTLDTIENNTESIIMRNSSIISNIITKSLSAALLVGLISSANIATADTLKLAHVYEVEHPLHLAALKAAEELEARTEGRYSMEVYPASSLGQESALNEALSLGTIDVIYTGGAFAGSIYGPVALSDFPFILRGIPHWKAYIESDLFKEITQGFAEASGGNTIAAISYYGTRHVTANKPILKPEDMKGLKIRVPNAPAYVLFPKATGANPTPMAFSEVYLGLQQGVVDAQENPLTTIKAKKFYEVQSDISLTGHLTNSIITIISATRNNSMNDEDRAILNDVLKETAAWSSEQIITAEQELVGWFKEEGINIHEVDRAPFMDIVKPELLADGMPFSKEQYEKLQAIPDAQ